MSFGMWIVAMDDRGKPERIWHRRESARSLFLLIATTNRDRDTFLELCEIVCW